MSSAAGPAEGGGAADAEGGKRKREVRAQAAHLKSSLPSFGRKEKKKTPRTGVQLLFLKQQLGHLHMRSSLRIVQKSFVAMYNVSTD